MAKKALGRGLGALIPQQPNRPSAAVAGSSHEIPLAKITPNPDQPRKHFDEEELKQLAASITSVGIIEPLVLRRRGDGYEIITGERRYRASLLAGLSAVPAVVRDADDDLVLEMALIENIQRADLNPLEEAMAYRELLDRLGLRQEDLATRVGKSRTALTNSLRLLTLPEEIRELVIDGRLSAGHARAVLMAKSKPAMLKLAHAAVDKGLSVRQLEELAGNKKDAEPVEKPKPGRKAAGIRDIEQRLEEAFGTRVSIRHGKKGGKIEIIYFSNDDLDRILEVAEK